MKSAIVFHMLPKRSIEFRFFFYKEVTLEETLHMRIASTPDIDSAWLYAVYRWGVNATYLILVPDKPVADASLPLFTAKPACVSGPGSPQSSSAAPHEAPANGTHTVVIGLAVGLGAGGLLLIGLTMLVLW